MQQRTPNLLFIDESGNHDLNHVDPNWPVFVLVGLLIGESYYATTLVPHLKSIKEKYGIPKHVILHSRQIRRWEGEFQFLRDTKVRPSFYEDINRVFQVSRVRIYAVAIHKDRLAKLFFYPPNPYELSLSQLLSLVCGPQGTGGPWRPSVTRITAESRGKREDKELQAHYQNLRSDGLYVYGAENLPNRRPSTMTRLFPDRIEFATKKNAVAGLELTDLAAYPIGRALVNQQWDNPAYQAVIRKTRGLVEFP